MNCIIDTIQVTISINNFSDNELALGDIKSQFEYITPIDNKVNKKGIERALKINLNNKKGYNLINGLRAFKSEMEDAMKTLGIINTKEIDLNRVDIAIDSDIDFSENFKLLLFMFECITFSKEKSDKWYTTNLNTLKNNTIKLLDRSFDIVFYDKAEESNNRHLYKTRQEFRFKRISNKDYRKHLDTLIRRLDNIDNNIIALEQNMAKRLIKLLAKEYKNKNIKTFSEFVRKYDNYFYTKNILQEVYKASGLKGKCNNWLKDFRKNNHIELFTKTNVTTYKNELIKAIKKYKNS